MFKILLYLLMPISNLYAWDYNFYSLLQRSTSNNFYQSTQATEHDIYTTISGTVQMSNKRNILYATYMAQKYTNITANDNSTLNLNWTYHQTKKQDYSLGLFRQVYQQTPTNITDTSSSNQGAKFVSSWYKTFSNTQSGYLNLTLSYFDYYVSALRKDQSIDFSTGLQTYLGNFFSLTPSFSTSFLKSNDPYYEYFSIGPAMYFSYFPTEKLIFYTSGSYQYTSYAKRTFSLTSLSGEVVSASEKQTLVVIDVGIIYNINKYVPLQLSYSHSKNSSNYSYRDYKLSTISMSLSVNL